MLGRLEEAIDDYNQVIRLDPEFEHIYGDLADAKSRLGRHEEAIADYDRVIGFFNEDSWAYYGRGLAKQNLGRIRDAIADFWTALDLRPDFPEARRALAAAEKKFEKSGKSRGGGNDN